MEPVLTSLNEQIVEYFTIDVKKNSVSMVVDAPLVFTIDKPEGDNNDVVYSVYYYDPTDGDIVELYTRQAQSTISFMGYGSGEYLLGSTRTANSYLDSDPVESVTKETNSVDNQLYISLMVVGVIIILALIIFLYIRHRRKVISRVMKKKEERHNDQHNSDN